MTMAETIGFDSVRKIGLALPGVEESAPDGTPALKLRGKLLAWPAINKSAEPNSLAVRIDFVHRDELIAADGDTYYVTDHYMNYPVVLVRLSRIRMDALSDLLLMAWRFVSARAPAKRLPLKRRPRRH